MSHPDDPQAIAAIRQGDIDRYRESIERYQRQAYAVAWARLGDAALAEEAVQVSFIRAFRFLGWLRDPSRFAGWITRITRGVAINLGLRHRRELRRRERWALDPAVSAGGDVADATSGDDATKENADALRAALADLPARHRESLVLHYLENRTITESARSLGINEGAFKVRLHRARTALRLRLEHELESSLGRLGPRRSLVPAIMSSAVFKTALTDPGGTGSGLLAGIAAAGAKLLPAPFLVLLMPLLTLGVSLFCLLGDYLLKRASQMPAPFRTPEFVVGAMIFALVSAGWVLVFPQLKMAAVGMMYGVSTVVFTALLGWLAFGEALGLREILGLVLGLAGMLLLARPA